MARVATWNVEKVNGKIMHKAMDRLEAAGNVIAEKARMKCPVGTISRPMYKTGRYAGCEWTKRDAGALKQTIRVVRKNGDPNLNIWIMAGNKVTFYAQFVEFFTPFLRPALRGSKSEIRRIISNGTTSMGGTF